MLRESLMPLPGNQKQTGACAEEYPAHKAEDFRKRHQRRPQHKGSADDQAQEKLDVVVDRHYVEFDDDKDFGVAQSMLEN